MTRPALEFWFEFASTYSYPAAMRAEGVAAAAGVDLVWRPFLLGPLFNSQQGLTDSPFNLYPVKGRYMWRDLERICARDGLAFQHPSVFPRNSLHAARIAIVGQRAGWVGPFARAVYTANFARDEDICDHQVLAKLVKEAGGDPYDALNAAKNDEVKNALRIATEEAAGKGVFGAPSFVTEDGELFWGNDRLDEAVAWAAAHAKNLTREEVA
jgi:2-hydroxychromene-2-carboxylate isomerase